MILKLGKKVYDQYLTFNCGNLKLYNGYHNYTVLIDSEKYNYKFCISPLAIINWRNTRIIVPKSQYKSRYKLMKNIYDIGLFKCNKQKLEVLKMYQKYPDDYISIDNSEYIYDAKLLKIMMKINRTKQFYYTLDNLHRMYLYIPVKFGAYIKYKYIVQGILTPTIEIKKQEIF